MKHSKTLKILQVAPELAPFAKVGGLADVAGALTKEMDRAGHDVRAICPKYGFLQPDETWSAIEAPLTVKLGYGREEWCKLWETKYPGSNAKVFFVEYNKYYDRHEIYTGPWGSHKDNDERFAFLSRVAIDYCHANEWYPDIIHCHDWTTGLVPVYLNTTEFGTPLDKAASIFTIHNLQHQGVFGQGVLNFAGIPQSVFRPDNVESMGCVNMMKAGLYNSTKLTTVSPTYAREIQQPGLGCGLNHVLKFRAADLTGIINGIDAETWSPVSDPLIPANFHANDLSGKAVCKKALQEWFGLEVNPNVPIYGAVARLYDQKGLDLFAEIVPQLMEEMAIQIVVLGTGDPALESAFQSMQHRYPGRVGTFIGYDNSLSHLVEAGCDFFVMPSRFEPCGLNQMYSMAYGTLPIVRSTGGLVDSVEQYQEGHGIGTGFRFEEASAHALYYTIGWACATYYDRPEEFRKLQHNAMTQNLSWNKSAERYLDLYHWAIDTRLRGLGVSTDKTLTRSRSPFGG